MAQAFVPGLIAAKGLLIVRKRELPLVGETLPVLGATVTADQVVARAEMPGEIELLRAAEKLGLEPAEILHELKIKVGDNITKDQLLYSHRALFGLIRSELRASASGVVEFISQRTGHIGIRKAPKILELPAYLDGVVIDVVQHRSVEIAARGSVIQGIFGLGGERLGKLLTLKLAVDQQVEERTIANLDLRGRIVAGGSNWSLAALNCAAERGAVGVITGSIDDQTMQQFLGYDLGIALTGDEEIPLTIIITEGFGKLSISQRIWNLLLEADGHRCAINGATQVRAGAIRPEILIPDAERSKDIRPEQIQTELAKSNRGGAIAGALEVGAKVRVIRVPNFGAFGTVLELPKQPTRLETGASSRIAVVKLEGGRQSLSPELT